MRFIRSVSDVFGYSPFEDLKKHAELAAKPLDFLKGSSKHIRQTIWMKLKGLGI